MSKDIFWGKEVRIKSLNKIGTAQGREIKEDGTILYSVNCTPNEYLIDLHNVPDGVSILNLALVAEKHLEVYHRIKSEDLELV
jgi:hypothetical protein